MAATAAVTALAACDGGGGEVPAPPENVIAEGTAPDYYPAEYSQIIEGSKAEGGRLTIYSNTDGLFPRILVVHADSRTFPVTLRLDTRREQPGAA